MISKRTRGPVIRSRDTALVTMPLRTGSGLNCDAALACILVGPLSFAQLRTAPPRFVDLRDASRRSCNGSLTRPLIVEHAKVAPFRSRRSPERMICGKSPFSLTNNVDSSSPCGETSTVPTKLTINLICS